MKSIFHKNLIHPGVFTHPRQTQQPCDSAESQYTKSIEDETSIVPITSELQYFERRVHLYKGYPSSLEPLADLHSIIVRSLHRHNDNDATDHLNIIKYEVRSTTGKLLFFIKEQTDSFMRGVKCCAKPEPKVLNIMTCGDNTGIQLCLEYGLAGLCKKITTLQNSRRLGSVEVNWLSLYPLSYRSFRAISSHNSHSQRQEKFTVVQKGNRIVDLCGCGCFPSATPETSQQKKEFQVSFGTKGLSKGKIRKDWQSNFYTLSLFHGLDPVGKLILISSVMLIDLQSSRNHKTTKECNISALILQFLISLLFYIVFFILSSLFLFMIFRLLLK